MINLHFFGSLSLSLLHTLRFNCLSQDTTWPARLEYPEWPGDEVKELRLVQSRKAKNVVRFILTIRVDVLCDV